MMGLGGDDDKMENGGSGGGGGGFFESFKVLQYIFPFLMWLECECSACMARETQDACVFLFCFLTPFGWESGYSLSVVVSLHIHNMQSNPFNLFARVKTKVTKHFPPSLISPSILIRTLQQLNISTHFSI